MDIIFWVVVVVLFALLSYLYYKSETDKDVVTAEYVALKKSMGTQIVNVEDHIKSDLTDFNRSVKSEMSGVTGEISHLQGTVTAEMKGLSADIKGVSSEMTSNLLTAKDEMNGKVTRLAKYVDSETDALRKSDAKINDTLSTLTRLGKIAEIGQVSVGCVNTLNGEGNRVDTTQVVFSTVYTDAPKVMITPIHVEAITGKFQRYQITASQITTKGFNLNVSTWGDSQLVSVVVQYATVV